MKSNNIEMQYFKMEDMFFEYKQNTWYTNVNNHIFYVTT